MAKHVPPKHAMGVRFPPLMPPSTPESQRKKSLAYKEVAFRVLDASIFGAFLLAIEARRDEDSLTQTKLAELMGRDKANISKLLEGPQNWTVQTISDLAQALDLEVEFVLHDKHKPGRQFTPTGVVDQSDD